MRLSEQPCRHLRREPARFDLRLVPFAHRAEEARRCRAGGERMWLKKATLLYLSPRRRWRRPRAPERKSCKSERATRERTPTGGGRPAESPRRVTWQAQECQARGGRSVRQSSTSRDRTGMSTMWKVGGACTPLKLGSRPPVPWIPEETVFERMWLQPATTMSRCFRRRPTALCCA